MSFTAKSTGRRKKTLRPLTVKLDPYGIKYCLNPCTEEVVTMFIQSQLE